MKMVQTSCLVCVKALSSSEINMSYPSIVLWGKKPPCDIISVCSRNLIVRMVQQEYKRFHCKEVLVTRSMKNIMLLT